MPGDSYGKKGYARAAYCVEKSVIKRALAAFSALFDDYEKEKRI